MGRSPFSLSNGKDVRLPYTTTLTQEEVDALRQAGSISGCIGHSPGLLMRRFALERARQVMEMEGAKQAALAKEGHLRASVDDNPCAVCGVPFLKHSVYELGVDKSHVHLRASVDTEMSKKDI